MAGLNKVMLIGRLGRDPEIRYSQQGTAVVNFSIATSEQWTDKNTGDRQEKTEWHRIVMFGRQAEVCEKYLSKGKQIYIEGRLQTRTYEKDGQTHYITEIVGNNFQFLSSRQEDSQTAGGGQQTATSYQQADPDPAPAEPAASAPDDNFQSPPDPGPKAESSAIPDDEVPF